MRRDQYFGEQKRESLVEQLREHDVTVAPVYDVEEMLADDHFDVREMFREVQDGELGPVRTQGVTPEFSETPGGIEHLGPKLGADNESLFVDVLGYDRDFIQDLKVEGVI